MEQHLDIESLQDRTGSTSEADALVSCLREQPPRIPPHFGYDALGSHLFEEITELPDYYLTRVEDRLLRAHVRDIADKLDTPWIVELGSGSAKKTRALLAACAARRQTTFLPIDVSHDMLIASRDAIADDGDGVSVRGLWGRYEAGLGWITERRSGPLTIMLLGSTLGNATPAERRALLTEISDTLDNGDRFLVSVDLVKAAHVFETCYNDPPGYSAFQRFRLNHLAHLNRRFDGDFELDRFRARAHYNERTATVEGHLYATTEHEVTLRALELQLELRTGDAINVGFSAKFDAASFVAELNELGLTPLAQWIDEPSAYALFLFGRH